MKDLILFTGQSNMQGQTGVLPENNPYIEKGEEYLYLSDTLKPLSHPTGENISIDGKKGNGTLNDAFLGAWQGCGSLIPYFCEAYISETGNNVVAVQAAKGSTVLSYWQKGGKPYELLVDKFHKAEKKTGDVGKRYAVFLQGESDAIESRSTDEYSNLLTQFIRDLKKDINIDEFFIIRVARFTEDDRDFSILKAQEQVCKDGKAVMLTRITGELLQNPDKYQSYERAHYNNLAFSIIGAIAGKNMALYRKGISFSLEEEPYKELR